MNKLLLSTAGAVSCKLGPAPAHTARAREQMPMGYCNSLVESGENDSREGSSVPRGRENVSLSWGDMSEMWLNERHCTQFSPGAAGGKGCAAINLGFPHAASGGRPHPAMGNGQTWLVSQLRFLSLRLLGGKCHVASASEGGEVKNRWIEARGRKRQSGGCLGVGREKAHCSFSSSVELSKKE